MVQHPSVDPHGNFELISTSLDYATAVLGAVEWQEVAEQCNRKSRSAL